MKCFPHMPSHQFSHLSILFLIPAIGCASSFDGFYVGLSGGGTQMQTDMDVEQIVRFTNSTNPSNFFYTRKLVPQNGLNIFDTSWMAELRAGYGKSIGDSPFYMGLEIFGNAADRNTESSVDSQYNAPSFYFFDHTERDADINVKLDDTEFGVDIRPGIMLTPTTLFYARIGAAFNTLTLDVEDELALSFTLPEGVSSNSFAQNESDGVVGLRLGLGLENTINPSWSITADYIYTDYGSIKVDDAFDLVNPDETITTDAFTSEVTADVTNQTVLLGVNYYPNAREKHISAMIHPSMINQFNGFYGGVKGGLLVNNAQVNSLTEIAFFFEDSGVPVTDTVTESANLWNNKAIGEIFLGYGHLIENFGESLFYLGIELYGNLGDRESETTTTEDFSDTNIHASDDPYAVIKSSTKQKIDFNPFEWGVDTKFGRLFSNNTLIFGRVGFAINEIEAQTNGIFMFTDYNLDFESSSTFYAEENKDVTGLRLGVGLEQMVWRNLAVTADYIYTDYGSIDVRGTADTIGDDVDGSPLVTPDGFVSETNFDVQTHAVMMGLVYHL